MGALLSIYLTGGEFSLISLLGLFLLIGIVKKNAIMMIDFALDAQREGKLTVAGLMTHLSCADDPADPYIDQQAAAFRRAIAQARQVGLELPRNHAANSPATWTRPDLHFDMVRPGLSLYGLEPVDGLDHGLKPAMTWSAPVVAVKPMRKGEATSYARTWEAPADGFTAVIPAGSQRIGAASRWASAPGPVSNSAVVPGSGAKRQGVRTGSSSLRRRAR